VFILTLSVYVFFLFLIGCFASLKPTKTSEDIHLSGRTHGLITSSLSSCASTESGFVCLGMVGMGYSLGFNSFWILPAGIMGYLINWIVIGPKILNISISLKAVSITEIIERKTGSSPISNMVSLIIGLVSIIFLISYVSAQLVASGKVISSNLEIGGTLSIIFSSMIVIVYSCMGNFRAVAWTDNLQAILMFLVLLFIPIVVLFEIGGLDKLSILMTAMPSEFRSFTGGADSFLDVIMAIFPWLMLGLAYPGQPHAVSRLMAAKNKKLFFPAAILSCCWFVVIYGGAIFLGILTKIGFGLDRSIVTDPELILTNITSHLFSPFVSGLIIATILAAIGSTADSTLMSASTIVTRDYFRKYLTGYSNNFELKITRSVTLVLGTLSVFLATLMPSLVFKTVVFAWSGLGIFVGPSVIYCCLSRRSFAEPILFGLISTLICMVFFYSHSLNLLIGFIVNLMSILICHLFISNLKSINHNIERTNKNERSNESFTTI